MNTNPIPLYLQKYVECEERQTKLLEFVHLVACPRRPDGSYNYSRESLEQKAHVLLQELQYFKSKEPMTQK